jgi:hypothetical protein
MEQNVKFLPNRAKSLLQSEDLHQVLYHSPHYSSAFAV